MIAFLTFFLSIYSAMHAYVFVRLRSVFAVGRVTKCILTLLALSPLLIRLAEHFGMEPAARYLAWPAYIWMGALFLFVVFLGFIDALRICIRLMSGRIILTSSAACKIAMIITMVSTGLAIYEAQNLQTETLILSSNKLAAGSQPIRIVQISDVHIGMLFQEYRLAGVVKMIRDANPDIIVSTGDLVDGRLSRESVTEQHARMAAMLAAIPAPLGKFAITGNHEFYAGIDEAIEFTQLSGFRLLRDEAINLKNGMTIVGMDDRGRRKEDRHGDELRELKLLDKSAANFRLLLKHRPILSESGDGHFELQLSGHTHKGQLLPFYPLTWLEFKIRSGTTLTAQGSTIHVSRGTGTWGPPMRLFAPPEITVITIIPAAV